jgi:LmbE family N-acetylglucosaminyl deacetylase
MDAARASTTPTRGYELASALAHGVQRGLCSGWRRAAAFAATDRTRDFADPGRSCLVVAPHPDDETLGCGSTIARKRAAGAPVTVLIAADGRYSHVTSQSVTTEEMRAIRSREAVEACAALGVDGSHIVQLGLEDTKLANAWDSLVHSLRTELDRVDPDDVLVVSGLDPNPDHRTLNAALHHVLRSRARPAQVWEFPIWSWVDGPWFQLSDSPPIARAGRLVSDPIRSFTDASGRPAKVATTGFIAAKKAALAAYRSQTTNLTGERNWAVLDDEFLSLFLRAYEVFLAPPRRPQTRV